MDTHTIADDPSSLQDYGAVFQGEKASLIIGSQRLGHTKGASPYEALSLRVIVPARLVAYFGLEI